MTRQADPQAIADAALWLARLRSDVRTADTVDAFQQWLDESDENRTAFEAVNESWELAGGIQRPQQKPEPERRGYAKQLALAAALIMMIGIGSWNLRPSPAIATAVGEMRSLALDDGSTVILNTDTLIKTEFNDERRLVIVERGEASFQVARNRERPFVVRAGDMDVVATGTMFDVRWTEGNFAVTLAEGKVRVVDSGTGRQGGPIQTEMKPGQRLIRPSGTTRSRLLTVDLQAAQSWKQGRLSFDETPLRTAVSEVNRYSTRRIRLSADIEQGLPVSGVFDADAPRFARAVAELYELKLQEGQDVITISSGR